jgi:uncharacterized protein YecT (DUF1311 family)
VIKTPANLSDDQNVRANGIQATERAWLVYRDAWIAFAQQRYPFTDANAWINSLTNSRTERLKFTICFQNSHDSVCTPVILKQLEDGP